MNKGTLIVNGIDYSNGGGSASGIGYPNFKRLITTVGNGGNAFTYTATEDCWCACYITGNGGQIGCLFIDGEQTVGNVSTSQISFVIPLRKGQVLTNRANIGTYTVKVYGVQGGTRESSGDNYSTEEQIIGTWIDGKPLYRKVYDMGIITSSGTTSKPINISNLDKICKLYGVLNGGSTGISRPLPMVDSTSANAIRIDTNGSDVRCITYGTWNNYTATIIIEYTKTTDASVASLSLDDVAPLSVEDVEE